MLKVLAKLTFIVKQHSRTSCCVCSIRVFSKILCDFYYEPTIMVHDHYKEEFRIFLAELMMVIKLYL